ncbi:hypothetical protein ACFOEW_11090 [Alteromonas oceani]|uniref:Lipoprotein n=1 Tax=Alteromonas oceani TaxID=2071609 RepID=A0ABV7K4E7_9ALTE|nr:hypothetical protein [Alteromonas oceani]
MTRNNYRLLSLLLLMSTLTGLLAGCVSKSAMPVITDDKAATVTIYRSDELQGSLTDVYIGWDDEYFISLAPQQHTQLLVNPGFKTFKIRAHADWSNELALDLTPQQEVCLIAEVNPQNVVGLNWVVSGYRLRQLPCESLTL